MSKSFFPCVPLTGTSVQLEPLQQKHYEGLKQAANDERIWYCMPFKADADFFDVWFQEFFQKQQTQTQLTYVIRKKEDDLIVGSHSYYDIDFIHKRLEIGYSWVTPSCWGTVLAHESSLLLLANAFETWGMNRVQLAADPRNKRSCNSIKKLGAVEEGILREHMLHHHGLVTDTLVFSILAREWIQVKENLQRRQWMCSHCVPAFYP